jgi:hypothetical protein
VTTALVILIATASVVPTIACNRCSASITVIPSGASLQVSAISHQEAPMRRRTDA